MSWTRLLVFLVLISVASALIPYKNKEGPFRRSSKLHPRLFENRSSRFSKFKDDGPETNDRIERVAKVFKYDLTITPYMKFDTLDKSQLQDDTFDGDVTIHFQLTKQYRYLPFRAENLDVFQVVLKNEQNQEILELSSFEIDPDTTVGKVIPVMPFEVGKNYSVRIVYSGTINKGSFGSGEGLYYNTYETPEGKDKQVVTTFFEPTNSRKVFPNLDDLWFKAVISFTLIYPKGAKVYSNMKQIDDGYSYSTWRQSVTFHDTPLMSTYLFAFAVGDFAEASAKTRSNIPVRAMAVKHLSPGLQNSANIGADCIDAMEQLVNVKFPLPKLDNNFGMIVYEQVLITDPKIASRDAAFETTLVMCHEISHQWFGDLVTADHWGVEFLHESFANYFENRASSYYFNDEDKEEIELFFLRDKSGGLNEMLGAKHPLVTKHSYFDGVTYLAGGGMLRMFEATLGSDTFYNALNIYLTKNAWGNADQNNLIDAFEQALNKQNLCGSLDIRTVMNDFFLKPFYPIVTIALQNNKYVLSQQSSNASSSDTWNIPIFVWNPNSKKTNLIWLLSDNTVCTTNGFNLDPSIKYVFNYRGYSFARVRPPDDLLQNILNSDTSNIDPVTQFSIVLDRYDQEYEKDAEE
ncbi:Peptidase family M1 [Aphelenchoides bicaudatus]|nr:Peptidase family M1 [Aphelenchoides bicaudatus]